MKKLIFILFTLPFLVFAQEKGIHFEHNTTWAKVKEKAKKENKFIFVDAFTTWCGPCKYMSDNIFPQEKVGTFFNEKFVNLKIQMDETPGDNEDVKSWRAEAKRFAKDYAIAAYPTFLIFNPNGELVHRIVGGGEADEFIAMAKESFDPSTQYETIVKNYKANPKDVEAAKAMAKAATKAYDKNTAAEAIASVIENSSADAVLTKEFIPMLRSSITSVDNKAFELIRNNKAKVDEVMGAGKADAMLGTAVINSVLMPKLRASQTDNFDQAAEEAIKAYPDLKLQESFMTFKPNYYRAKKDWTKYREAVNHLIASGAAVSETQLNSFAWTIFENCTDPVCLEAALAWSKKSLEKKENPQYLDTYANILHKSGKTKEAIAIQEKAISLAAAEEKADYESNLALMKKGLPTWETE
ncbi:thioredoxin fold domain-containing protein [Sphingobacterium sp. PU5-4]|uniref:Thioredoxin fold domain-containing protein n=1 Tax=Sphingobacterium tenebrionis TaxID=3111775 RepID=A0ABU8I8S0_9SPHI